MVSLSFGMAREVPDGFIFHEMDLNAMLTADIFATFTKPLGIRHKYVNFLVLVV